jgi:hypothetical protein
LIPDRSLNPITITVIMPGLLLTLITQVHWVRYRRALRAGLLSSKSEADSAGNGRGSTDSRDAARGSRHRRRGSRAGRSRRGRG